MASKQNQLVQTLLDQNQQLNATQLANSLGVSVRTVHNYINAVNAQYPDAIVSTPTGYRIAPAMAQQMLHQSPNDIPQNAQDRCTYILNRLVQKGGSLNLYDLCDEIYISATTFHGLMGKMRRLTREYDLSLAVSGDTVTLTGSERNKRRSADCCTMNPPARLQARTPCRLHSPVLTLKKYARMSWMC